MASHPSSAFLAQLTETLAGAMPGGSAEERCDAARAALEALQPCDIVEAMLAARVIAAHHATMDGYRRAMQPGIGDAEAVRLRNNAIAASRSFDAALRTLDKRRQAAEPPSRSRQSPATERQEPGMAANRPAPAEDPGEEARMAVSRDVPRDTSGNPVPLWRGDGVTVDQRRVSHDETPGGEQQVIGEVHRERRPAPLPG
jgi:hypothetical protein